MGQKAQELGPHRDTDDVCAELRASRNKLEKLYGDKLSGVLVPPWNRIAGSVVRRLPGLGFTALSTFGDAHEAADVPGLIQLNTHLDIIDWRGTRGGRDPHWLINELARLLAAARNHERTPIGILAHHLVHDEVAWGFLEDLLEVTTSHPAAAWHAADELVASLQTE